MDSHKNKATSEVDKLEVDKLSKKSNRNTSKLDDFSQVADLSGISDLAKIREMQDDVNQTKVILEKNIDTLISNIERLEVLDEKTQALETDAQLFAKQAQTLKAAEQGIYYGYYGAPIGGLIGLIGGFWAGYSLLPCLVFMMLGAAAGYGIGYGIGYLHSRLARVETVVEAAEGDWMGLFKTKVKEKIHGTKKPAKNTNEVSPSLTQWFELQRQKKQSAAEEATSGQPPQDKSKIKPKI